MIKLSSRKLMDTRTLVGASLLTGISIILTRAFSVILPLAGLPALRFGFGEIPLAVTGILFGPLAGGLSGAVADILGVIINPQGAFFPGFTLSSILWGVIPGIIYKLIRKRMFRINFNIINTSVLIGLAFGVVNVLFSNNVLTLKNGTYYLYAKPMPIFYAVGYVAIVLAFIVVPIIVSRKEKQKNKLYTLDKILFTITVPYVIISLGLNTLWLSIMFQKGFVILLPGRILAGLAVIPMHSTIVYTLSKYFKYVKEK
ncbi:folate family ECF transporter S component [Brassicibacter mesophilus]|uniref:folate family ECF transporter S component n=1 Tax=Brassicibacter mesophilus TaxID=745119 RepID=UPI003D1942B2